MKNISKFALAAGIASALIPAFSNAATLVKTDVKVGTGVTVNSTASVHVTALTSTSTASSSASMHSQGPEHASDQGILNANSNSVISTQYNGDVKSHSEAAMKADTDLTAVENASDSVSVSYREPAKLFGFIKVHVSATAEARADGSVSVTYPWYAIIMTKDRVGLENSVKAHVGTAASADSTLSANTRIHLIDLLQAGLREHAEASVGY